MTAFMELPSVDTGILLIIFENKAGTEYRRKIKNCESESYI